MQKKERIPHTFSKTDSDRYFNAQMSSPLSKEKFLCFHSIIQIVNIIDLAFLFLIYYGNSRD